MVNSYSIPSQAEIAEFIERNTGLHYAEDKFDELERGLTIVSKELGFDSYYSFLLSIDLNSPSRDLINNITKQLTIGETYFFREPASFNALANVVLPELVEKKGEDKRLRIWSAACCTGEEVYSIAITVLNFFGSAANDWRIEILASDVNPAFIAAAQKGEYSAWSFRNTTSPSEHEKWMTRFKDIIRIKGVLKKYIRFETINLKTDDFPSIMNGTNNLDIIFCRNVFIYFNDELRAKIIRNFYNCLNEDGSLFLGLTELPYQSDPRLRQRVFKNGIFFTKGTERRKDTPKKPLVREVKKPAAPAPQPPRLRIEPAPGHTERKTESQYSLISELYNNGDYSGVIENFRALGSKPLLEKSDAGYRHVRLLYINALVNSGSPDAAARECERIIEVDKLDHISYFVYSKILFEQGYSEKAFEMLQKSLFINPEFIASYFLMYVVNKKLNRMSEAEKYRTLTKKMLDGKSPDSPVEGLDGMSVMDIYFILDVK
ncbi:MAG: hypothetical protein HUU54_12630 [Ignavibacteriaceae bacterium]|nr:hypothetical protein [Ignavibacteriaceae bacterium]